MRGMTFGGDRTVEFIEVPDPVPGSGEVVLEMKASGICGSDLHMYRGPRGMSLLGATPNRARDPWPRALWRRRSRRCRRE